MPLGRLRQPWQEAQGWVRRVGEIAAAVSDNSATLIHKALTWWFNFTGRPSSGALKAATLTAPTAVGAVAKACNSF
jgi:hypothetical protein